MSAGYTLPRYRVVDLQPGSTSEAITAEGLPYHQARDISQTMNEEWQIELEEDYGPFWPRWDEAGGSPRYAVEGGARA